jgi:hypothetical protein
MLHYTVAAKALSKGEGLSEGLLGRVRRLANPKVNGID